MNCIVIDIGNTSTGIGLAAGGTVTGICHLQGGLKDRNAIRHVVKGLMGDAEVDGAILASVVPAVNPVWISVLRDLFGAPPIVVRSGLNMNVRIRYPRPRTIGADRLANACGAISRYGAPVIVADFGTALTFDVVSADGSYVGGVIVPGLPLMTDYLWEKTALLPRIRLKGVLGAVGRSTAGAMRIGARVGYRGMVREIVAYLTRAKGLRGARLCATGGYAKWALAGIELPFKIDPDLTLYGLSRIFELNVRTPEERRR